MAVYRLKIYDCGKFFGVLILLMGFIVVDCLCV